MSLGPRPLGVAFATGLPAASVTTIALQLAYPFAGAAQMCSVPRADPAGDGWAMALVVVPTSRAAAADPTATDRVKRFMRPPGRVARGGPRRDPVPCVTPSAIPNRRH